MTANSATARPRSQEGLVGEMLRRVFAQLNDEALIALYERLSHQNRRRFFSEFDSPTERMAFLLSGGGYGR